MDEFERGSAERPVIFYNGVCPPCQWMSRLAVLLSLGLIRRAPLAALDSTRLYEKFPQARGQIVLLYQRRVAYGRPVFASLPGVVLAHAWSLLRHVLAPATTSPFIVHAHETRGKAAEPGDDRPRP